MKTTVEKIAMLKNESLKKRFRIIKRVNKSSPTAHYGCIYHTYREKNVPYPICENIVVFSTKLTEPNNVEKVIEECMFWGRNQGETHLAPAVKPLIEDFFKRKAKRDADKEKKLSEIKERLGI